MSFPDVELLHLLLDELHGELLGPRRRQVLPAEAGAHTYMSAEELRTRRKRDVYTWLVVLSNTPTEPICS